MIIQRIKKLFQTNKEPPRADTCEHCAHLYFNNDGSTACDSPYEKYCLMGNVRFYKETRRIEE